MSVIQPVRLHAEHIGSFVRPAKLLDAIRETGATSAHTAVIFYYGIFPETIDTLAGHGVALHSLCTWWDVLAEARESGAFDADTLNEVEAFLTSPRPWQEARRRG